MQLKNLRHFTRLIHLFLCILFFAQALCPAYALDALRINPDADVIDISPGIKYYHSNGDTIQISTLPDKHNVVHRIAVKAQKHESSGEWIVFSLINDSDERLERILVIPHYQFVKSGLLWPDLGGERIRAITASTGIGPKKQKNLDADQFVLTIDPGTTVTYVAELNKKSIPQINLWTKEAYQKKVAGVIFFQGLIIGIACLLALFLTVIFIVKGSAIFPAAAALSWSVFFYACTDFGFMQQLLALNDRTEQILRAVAESILVATLMIFLFAYLNLTRWFSLHRTLLIGWLLYILGVITTALLDPSLASGLARISIGFGTFSGLILISYLAFLQKYDRAILIAPTWFFLFLCILMGYLGVTGKIDNDIIHPALIGGLVLNVILISFTILQHAFSGNGLALSSVSETERQALALIGSGDNVFDWDLVRDYFYVSAGVEYRLGIRRGALNGSLNRWLDLMHPLDRKKYSAPFDEIIQLKRQTLVHEFRLRTTLGKYEWYELKARPILGNEKEVIRIIGVLTNITEEKKAQERLMHDAIYDSLTRLPNKVLFFDRLNHVMTIANTNQSLLLNVVVIDIDQFRIINEMLSYTMGDSVLLTTSRRLSRLITQQDTLSRISGNRFALIVVSCADNKTMLNYVESLKQSLSIPITFLDREIFQTVSIGVCTHSKDSTATVEELYSNAELAMLEAKKRGGDRIEMFHPGLHLDRSLHKNLERDIESAIERKEIKILFQPIVRLSDNTISGYKSLVRWEHPKYGIISPSMFVPIAEQHNVIMDLMLYCIQQVTKELAAWQRNLILNPALFVTIQLFSSTLLNADFVNELTGILVQNNLVPYSFKLELSESLVMENPESALIRLKQLHEEEVSLILNQFGIGYSSIAYLNKIPFEMIRIDQSFIKTIHEGETKVLRSLLKMADELSLVSLADNLQHPNEIRVLSELGCVYGSGPLFQESCEPLEVREMLGYH